MDSERLLQLTHGDRDLAVFVQERLKDMARGVAGPVWRELAKDVLAGRVDLRDAVLSNAYSGEMSQGVAAFTQWHDTLGSEERHEVEAETRRQLRNLGSTRSLD